MKEKWFTFKGVSVFDHEQKRFWHRNEIKELAKELWINCEMTDVKQNPDNSDLIWIFKQEFPSYISDDSHVYWDDYGRWEYVETPYNVGFGIIMGDTERFYELVKIMRMNGMKQ